MVLKKLYFIQPEKQAISYSWKN